MQKFTSRHEISEEILLEWLQSLEVTPCRHILRRGVFAEEELDFDRRGELMEKISHDLEYQEGIARSALERYDGNQGIGIQSYHWEISLESTGTLRKQRYLSINLVLETTTSGQGRILFPAMVVKCTESTFKYWEIINIEDALDAVQSLLND